MRAKAIAGFRLTDASYPPALRVPEHCHQHPYLCLLVGGGYAETQGRSKPIPQAPGSIVFHPAFEVHSGAIATGGGRCLHVEICSPDGRSWADALEALPDRPLAYDSGPVAWLGARMYREFAHQRTATDLILEGIALELVGHLLRRPPRDRGSAPPWIDRVVERLHDELEKPLTVKGIAADLGVSALRLSRTFRRLHGESIGEMHRRLRIERACRVLATTGTPVVDVALDLGFADQSHFTRVFRLLTGLTPARYRGIARTP